MTGVAERRRLPRNYLFVPGDAEAKLSKALDRAADAIIVDLEDAVAARSKALGRDVSRRWLLSLPRAEDNPVEVWVRINPGTQGHDDLAAVLCPALRGVCVAKTEDVGSLEELSALLAAREQQLALEPGSMLVQPQLESARALSAIAELARAPRVVQLQIGEVDLLADCGMELSDDEREMLFARSLLVVESIAAGLPAPVGPVSVDFRDLELFRRSCIALRRLGFRSRACIHPAQVTVAAEVFTPSQTEVERAQIIVRSYEEALARGVGVVTDDEGRMIDEAVVRASRYLLAAASRDRVTASGGKRPGSARAD